MPVYGKSFGSKITDAAIAAMLIVIAFVSLFPILHSVAISFSDKAAVSAGRVTVWPVQFNMANYATLMGDEQFFTSFGVSVKRVLLGGAIQFILTVLMAFPLSRDSKRFRSRNVYMWIVVVSMLFHGGLIPWYLTVKSVGLIDTIWALVLPGAVPVFNVILLMNFFKSLPKELDEAAMMDGAGPWYTMIRLYIPLALPAIATVTLFSIVGHWNAFFDGLILIHDSANLPLQTYINTLLRQPAQYEDLDAETLKLLMQTSDQGLNAAKIMISMVPILLIYPLLQRYFVHGIVLGSVKE
ncbi:putative aldouronate transport system permease protein [Paenibacillus sp. UNCCL117]|uniref:carbohydrate ABC transporter permease n=1 Tax=Paenibacillus sp. cl123 TaxID=1761875 RepID=UPI00087EE7BF|nr:MULTISPECIES: carbohydrate ABC transporter permease [unclassified Paenibacillus]SDD51631.1 putative aldouronate transport system permease protein [Paenibacillus sp. cl123]SFW49469.1 putative aldouronate transport system permease protein [Paenibacillus sp. UNCCL117]